MLWPNFQLWEERIYESSGMWINFCLTLFYKGFIRASLAMQETEIQALGQEDPLEKGVATHSSIAWKIPWTGEPGGLQSMGSQSWTQLSDQPLPSLSFVLYSVYFIIRIDVFIMFSFSSNKYFILLIMC